MDLLPADYALGAFALVMTVLGLFRGLSGTLAFVAGLAAATAGGGLAWRLSPGWFEATWSQGAFTLVAALVVFGLVRLVVKSSVRKLLAQPTDAIGGVVVGALVGVLPFVAWAFVGRGLEYSMVAREIAAYVR